MAGSRLEHWNTLPRDVLAERISAEQVRHDLTFAETQLLNAARERLSHWRAPSQRSKVMNQEKKIETTEAQTTTEMPKTDVAKEVVGTFVQDVVKSAKASKAKKATAAVVEDGVSDTAPVAKPATKKTASPKAAKSKASTAAPAASKKKEATVAKKTKTAPKTVKAAKSNGEGKRIPEDAVLKVKKSFKNPYKEGTGPFKRFEVCMKSDGKTYGALRAMTSLKNTTPLNFVKQGGGEFIHAGK
jgi:hypothetical protein